jgi:ELWxxDGT repeat protein
VITPDGTHAYFGSSKAGKVVKVALTRPPNPALVAANEAYSTDYVTPLSVPAPGVLANDVDTGDGDPLSAGQASDPAGGSVVLNADGSFTYTPDVGFSGTDTFTYTADDAKDYSAPATVSITVGAPPAGVQSVGGGACGYYTNISLFGGAPERRGCGQTADIPAGTSPSVSLPAAGSAPITATKPEGAMGLYGPAAIFSGQWPEDAAVPSNSGPLTVSTQGATGEGGSATSSADVTLFDTPVPVRCYGDPPGTTNCGGPGGIGPGPVTADEAHSSCVADESGLFASASFVNGVFDSKHDVSTQLPIVSEPIPAKPPPNYTRSGTLDHVGDSYTVVFNEQILGPDSITVNAVHMYLLGPTAVGDMVVAQSRCAVSTNVANAAPLATNDSYSVAPGTDLVVPAAGVLANDTDADAQALAVSKVLPTPPPASGGGAWTFGSDPAHGTLDLGTDGSFTYTPDVGFEGTDTFAYLASDPRGASDQATVTVTVAPPLGISASPASVNPGAPVTATWSGIVAPTASDWVGLYDSASSPDPALLAWAYTDGSPDGSLSLTVPSGATPGAAYELRLFTANSYDRLATSAPFAVVASAATVSASPTSVNPGAPVTATWSAIAAPTATDWVGLYDSSAAPDAALLAWAFTNGSAAGSLSLSVPASATLGTTYELRLFSANSYTRLATSAPFSVVAPTAAPQSATMVADINPGSANGVPYTQVRAVNGTAVFGAEDSTYGSELWKTDGTAAGTTLVKDINPGTAGSFPDLLTNLNGTLYFMANDGASGTELWKTDGTAAGTVQVADINPGAGSSIVFQTFSPTAVGNTLFFGANDGTHGTELWKSDGTAAGTVMVNDINSGSSGSVGNAPYLINFNGTLLFRANDGTTGLELWQSDGTAAGTVQVADINPGSGGSSWSEPVVLNGAVFFAANDGAHGGELWKTDGTSAGTVMVFDYLPSLPGYGLAPDFLTAFNGAVYFRGNGGDGFSPKPALGRELWKSDGTAAGTVLVKDIYPGANSALTNSEHFNVANGVLFFGATDGTTAGAGGRELWKTDGSTAGTVRVKDINPGTGSSIFGEFQGVTANSLLYFAASDGTVGSAKGSEVWQSDGTAAGTVRTADVRPGTASSSPEWFANVGGTVYFTANDGIHGRELWRFGSPAVAAPAVSASPATVAAGSPVTATWSNIVSPGPTDWVGLYPASSTPDSGLVAWAYTNGAAAGSLNLTVPPGSPPGTTYELRLFSNNSYTRIATSAPISVVASTATIAASPLSANPGGPLTATWSGIGAPTGTDWVGLYDSSSTPDSGLLAWAYTNGTAAGSVNLFVPSGAPLGSNYELRLFTNNSYTRIATSAPFSVALSNAAISATPSSVANGSPVTATWLGIGAPNATDWVGLYASGADPDPAIVAWAYTGGAADGSLNLTVPAGSPPGATYELRLYSNNSYTRLATSAPFSVT